MVAKKAQQALRPVTVLEARSSDQHGDEQPEGINEDMTFSSFHLFSTVKAFGTPTVGGFDRLGVQASGTGLPGATQKRPQIPAQDVMNTLPRSVFAPDAKVVVDNPPGGESLSIIRQALPVRSTYKMALIMSRFVVG